MKGSARTPLKGMVVMKDKAVGCHIVLLQIISIPMLVICMGAAYREQRIYARSAPVEAHIISFTIRERWEETNRTDGTGLWLYWPVARFSYSVDGRRYESRRLALSPLESLDRDWARHLTRPYSEGDTVTAYYDTANPRVAVLRRYVQPKYYGGILFSGGLLSLALMNWTRSRGFANRPSVRQSGRHYQLHPARRIGWYLRDKVIGLVLWALTGLAAALLYTSFPGTLPAAVPPPPLLLIGGLAVYLVIGAFGVHGAFKGWRIYHKVHDATIWLLRDHLVLGRANPILYVQYVVRNALVQDLSVGARMDCLSEYPTVDRHGNDTTGVEQKTLYEEYVPLATRSAAPASPELRVEGRLPVPAELFPTTDPDAKDYPRYYWSIVARLQLKGGPLYEAVFPVTVRDGRNRGGAARKADPKGATNL